MADLVYHELKDTTIPEYLFIRDLPGRAGGEMTIFEQVKACVTARQAAEHYGIKVKNNGMACCPFHNDRHPSMKIDKNYHCFACGVGGDAIDFTAGLFGLTQFEAAKKLIEDFGLDIKFRNKNESLLRNRTPLKAKERKGCTNQRKSRTVVAICNRRADQISEMDSVLERVLQTRTRRRVARIIYGGIGK